MNYLLAAEWLKLRKRWMPRILLLITLILVGLLFWGIGTSATSRPNLIPPRAWLAALLISSFFAGFIWPVLGGSWSGNEYGWGTVRLVLTRRPNRIQFALGGLIILLIAMALVLLVIMLFGTVAGIVVAILTGSSAFTSSDFSGSFLLVLAKSYAATWFVMSFYVLLAFAAGTVFQSVAAGIGIGIGLTVAQIVAFGIFSGLGGAWKTVADHFPFQYTSQMVNRVVSEGTVHGFTSVSSTSPGVEESIVALAIYSAILLAITLYMARSRDITS